MEEQTPQAEGSGAELSDSQMDAILGGQSVDEVTATPAAPEAQKAEPVQQALPELSFDYNGKPIKVPFTDPKVAQWARQGYDYNQKMADFNRRNAEIESRAKQAEQLASKYKQYEEFISTPEGKAWWDHVQGSWESRQSQGADPNNPLSRELSAVRKELDDLKQFKNQLSERQALEAQRQEDNQLQAEIDEVTKGYPSIDFKATDAEGKSLEIRVLEHAQNTGISSFRAAFRDFYYDDLVKLESERAKEALAQDLQKQKSLGILGKSQVPKTGVQVAKNIKQKSYDDLLAEGAAEFGIKIG